MGHRNGKLATKDPQFDQIVSKFEKNYNDKYGDPAYESKTSESSTPRSGATRRPRRKKSDLQNYIITQENFISTKYEVNMNAFSRGHIGAVHKATNKETGEVCAVKNIEKPVFSFKYEKEQFFDAIINEIKALKKCRHENVIELYDVYEDQRHLYLVMEYCSGGELFEEIHRRGRFTELDASAILRQIISALEYMHSKKLAHCDIKPENLMFSSPESNKIKIVDFGMAKALKWRKYYHSLCGTPYYVAPEVLRGHYDESCDMWSVGVIMFVMLFGFPPFYSHHQDSSCNEEIYERVQKGFTPKTLPGYGPWFPEKIKVSHSAKSLISSLLTTDLASRSTADEALSHPWLKGETCLEDPLDITVLKSLQRFNASCAFKQLVTDLMTDTLSQDQIGALHETFQALDTDGDGVVTYVELKKALLKVNTDLDEDEVYRMLEELDVDGDGVINYEELVRARVYRKLATKEMRLWEAFRKLDANADGYITAEELIESVGADKADDINKARVLIGELDLDNDGKIDYEEFIRVWEEDAVRHKFSMVAEHREKYHFKRPVVSPRAGAYKKEPAPTFSE